MEKGDYFDRMRRPTMEQIRYLQELIRAPKLRGTAAKIAKEHEISHASVSRFFRDCRNAGYLTEDGCLTEDGRAWLDYYEGIEEGLTRYLEGLGVPQADILRNVRIMEEQMDDHVIAAILDRPEEGGWRPKVCEERPARPCDELLKQRMETGEYRVDFVLLRYASDKRWEQTLSMADRGFEKPALLVCGKEQTYLELTPCEMEAVSRINGSVMSGHLSSLSYFAEGTLVKVGFVDGKVRIPLEVCSFHPLTEGRISGMIPVTVTCSAKAAHMPESTALLVFWL